MKRLVISVATLAVLGAVTAALAAATPWSGAKSDGAEKASTASRLPALPAEVRQRKRWLVGVKCDFPPFGYIDRQQKIAGFEVDVARRFAELAFGRRNRLSLTCVTTPSRIPTLEQKRVDYIISTLSWSASREQQIDYSYPYYNATGRLLVRTNSPIRRLADLNGRTVTTTTTSIYAPWVRNCFRGATLLLTTSPVAAVENLRQGRADAFMFDDTFLLGIAANDPALEMTTHKFLNVPYGIGIRKGESAMKRWLNAAILQMKRRDEFWPLLQRNSPRRFWRFFRTNVPRPKTKEAYPRGRVPEEECPR
jgi:polar amino acid transport system substrate-binding protein